MSGSTIKGATVLVTGGAGFIGSNLCEDLLKHKNRVICLDNFSTGHRKNIEELIGHPDFILAEGDIRHKNDCERAMKGVEIVLQQAALGSVPRSIDDPVTTNEVNVTGFLNVLVAARDARVKRLVYASSSSVYGDLQQSPKKEECTGQPISPYAVTKITNEKYAHVFGLNYGMQIIGLRYFNVFGRNQDPNGPYAAAIPKFIRAFTQGSPPVVHGDGSGSRDFTYVANVLKMNHLAATTDNKAAIGQVFNTGTGKSASLTELISIIKRLLSGYDQRIADIKPTYGPPRAGDIAHSLASIEKAKGLLGYNPSYNLEDGLKEAISWYWSNYRHD